MSKALSNQLKLLRKSRSALAAGDLEEYERLNAEADNEVEEGLEEEEVSTEPADIEPVVEEVSSEEVPSSFPPTEPSSTTPTPLEPIPEVLHKGEIPGAGSPTWVELSEMRGEGAFGTAFAHLQDFVLENAREGGIRAATPLKDRKLESTLGSVENVGIAGALSSAGHPYLAAATAVAGLYPAALTLSNEVLGTNFGEGGTGFGGDPLDPTQWIGGVVLPRTIAQDIQDNKDRKILKTFPKNSPESRAARERLKVTELSDIIASVVQLNNPGEVASGYMNDRAYEDDFINAAGQMGESAHKVEALKMGLDLASANEAIKDRFSGALKRDEIKDLYYQTDWTGRGRESGVNISGPIEQLTAVTMDKIRRENPGISAEELRARADKHVETEVQLALQNHPFAEGIAIINIGDADALKELYEMEDRWGAAYGELGRVAAQTLAPIYASMTPVPMTQRMGLMSPEQVYGQSSLVSGLRLGNLAPSTWWAAGSKFDKYPVVGPLLAKLGLIDPEDAVLSPEELAWMMEGGDVIDAAPHAVSALFDHIYPDAAPGSDEWNAMTAQLQKDHPFLTQAPIIAAAMFKEPDALSMMFGAVGKFGRAATLSAKSIKFKKYIENIDENILPRLQEIAAQLEPYSVKSTDAKGTATYTHKDVPIELEDELGQAIQALTDSALKAAGDDPELQAFFQTNLLGRLKGSTGEAVRANWQTSVKARRALSELKGKNVKGVDDALKAAGHELRALEAGAQAADGILDISTTKLRMVVESLRGVMPEFFEAEGLNVAAVKNLSRKRLQTQLENATRDTLEQAEAIETLKHNNSEAWATGASMFARLQEKKALLEQAVDIAKRGLAVGDEVEVFTGVALDAGKFIEYKDVDGVKRAFIRIETENGSVVKHFDIKDVAFDFHGLVNKLNPAHGAPWSAVGKRFRDLAKAAFFKETEGAFKAADGSIWVPAKGLDSLKEGQTVRWLDDGELKSVEEMTVKTKGTLEDGTDTATIFTGKAKKPSMVVTVPLDQVFTLRHRDAEEQLDGILAILEARARAATMHRGEKVTEEAINAWYARNFKGFATDLKGEVKPLVEGKELTPEDLPRPFESRPAGLSDAEWESLQAGYRMIDPDGKPSSEADVRWQIADMQKRIAVLKKEAKGDPTPERSEEIRESIEETLDSIEDLEKSINVIRANAPAPTAAQGDLFDDIMYQGPATAGAATAVEAVEAARLWKELGTESPYFKKWFGDSKIVGEDGKPLKVYHGSSWGGFTEFEELHSWHFFAGERSGAATYAGTNRPIDFTRKGYQRGIYDVYLRASNPFEVDYKGGMWDKPVTVVMGGKKVKFDTIEDLAEAAEEAGHDGVKVLNIKDFRNAKNEDVAGPEYIVFDNTNIKSTSNRGTFDETGRILYQGEDVVSPAKSWDEIEQKPVTLGKATSSDVAAQIRKDVSGTKVASYIADNADSPVHRRIAERIKPFLKDTEVYVINNWDDVPKKFENLVDDYNAKSNEGRLKARGDRQLINTINAFAHHPSRLNSITYGLTVSRAESRINDIILRGENTLLNGVGSEVILHELVHAATVRRIEDGRYKVNEGSKLKDATNRLIALNDTLVDGINKMYRRGEGELPPGLTIEEVGRWLGDPNELVAYGLTNAKFQEYLKTVKLDKTSDKSLWSAFVETLADLLGLKGSEEVNALEELIQATDDLLEAPLKGLEKRSLTQLISKSDEPASVDDIVKVLFQEGDTGAKVGREALFAPGYEARGRIAFNPKLHPKPDDLIVVEHTTETKYLDLFMAEGIDATIRPPTSGMGRLTVQPDGSVRQSYIKDSGLYVAPADSLSSSQRVVIVTPAKSVELSLESKGLGYESGIAGLYGAKDAIMRGKIPAENVAGKMIYDWSDKEWKWIPNPNSPYRDRFEVDGPKLVTKAEDLLRQGEEGSAKAAVQFVEDNKAILYAFEQADVSSLLHEIGHVFRRDLLRSGWQGKLDSDVLVRAFTTKDERHIGDTVTFDGGEGAGWTDLTKAGKTRTPEELEKIQSKRSSKRQAALDKIAQAAEGISGPATWTVKSEERFTRAMEKYLATGRSPSLELDGVFKKFKSWMTEIYVQVRSSAIGRDIPKEVREVFDRMLTGAMTTEGYMKTFTKNQMMSMLDSKGIVYKSKELKESLAKKLSAADLNRTAEYRRFIKRQDDMAKQAAELAKLKTSTVATKLAPAEAKLVKSLEEELEPLHKKNNDARTALLKAKEKLDKAMSLSTAARRKLILRNVYDEQKSGEKVVLSTQNALIKFRGNPTAKAADHLAKQLVRIEAGNKKIAGNNLLAGVEGAIKDLKVMVEILKKEQMVRPARRNLMTHPILKSVIRDRGKGTWIIDPKEFVDSVDKFYVSGVLEEFLATPEGLFLSPIVKAAQQGNTKLTYTKAQMNRLQKTLKAMEGQYRAGELSQASMGAFLQMQRSYKNPRAKSIRVPVPFSDMVGGKGVLLNVPGSATRRFWHFYNVFDPTYSKLGQISPKIAKIASKQTRFVEHGLGDMHNLNMTHMGEDFLGAHVRYMDSTEAIKGRYGSTTVNTLGRGIFKEAQNFIRSNIQLTKKGRATFTEDAAGQYTKSLVNALERTFLNKPELKLQPRVSEAQATKLRPKVLELLSDENMTYDKFLRELGKAAGRSEFGRQDARGIMMSSRALLDAAAQQHTLRAMANTTSAMLTSEEALTMTRFMEGEMDKASDVDLLWSAAAKLGMDLSEGTIRAGTKHGQGEKARIKSLVRWNLDDGRSLTPEELVEHNTKLTATLKEKGVSPEDIKAQLIVSGQKITDPRQVFMPSQIGDAMRDSNRSFVKELDQYYSNPKGFDPQARIAKFVRYWKGMITSGLGLPRPKYYVNNILGDFSQMWQNHGIFTAGKVSAQNTLSNIPYIGPSIQNVTSKMAQKFEGIPILSTAVESVFNPQIGRIFTGEEGVAKFWDGDVSLSTLRENLALDGVLDTFTSREVSVNANQVAMELLGDAEKKYGKSIPDKFKARVARRLKHDVDGFAVQVQQRQRVGLYLELRKQGLDHDGAVKGVKDALYDWSQGFSSWEQSWQMGIVIPFYRFWRLAAGQMIRAFMEPFVMDSSEYMLKALTGQTQLARMKNQGRALSGIPKWAAYAEAEEAPNGEEDEVFWDGILAKPWWIRPGMTYTGKQATQRQKDFMLQDHGREIDTIATAMSAPMTAAEMYTIGTYILTTPFAAFAAAMDEDKKFNGLRAQKQLEKFAVDIGGPFVEALLKEKRTSKTGYRRISPGQESALKLLGDAADIHRDEEGRLVADEKALLFINNLPVIGSQWADGVNGMEWSKLHYEDEDLFNRILYMLSHISGPVRDYASSTDATLSFAHKDVIEKIKTAADKQKVGDDPKETYKRMNE